MLNMKRYSLDPNIIQSEMPQLETQEDFVQNFHPELLLVDRPKEIEEDSQYFSLDNNEY